jgi:hypothetical protein
MRDLRQQRQSRPGLIESIKSGLAVPILSDEAIFDLVLPGHPPLAEAYANYTGYTLDDRENLPRMARFYKQRRQKGALAEGGDFTHNDLRADFFDFARNFIYAQADSEGVDEDTLAEAEEQYTSTTVTGFAALLGYPRFDCGPEDPLQVLANLPFRVLLTTSPYTFLEAALVKAGKRPRTTVIRWRQDLRDLVDAHVPELPPGQDAKDAPLVCHLFGLERYTNSLVLTEDDYLEFLVDVNLARGDDKRDSVPAQVRKALSGDLLVLGFSLNSWAFRALYAGLIKSDDARAEKRGICVQLPPSPAEQAYLHDYLQREARFEVIWSDLRQYAQGLRIEV